MVISLSTINKYLPNDQRERESKVCEDDDEEDCGCYDGFICDIFSNG